MTLPEVILAAAVGLAVYAYLGYPALLALIAAPRRRWLAPTDPPVWPLVSITIPVYNEAAVIREKLEDVLGMDYPPDRRQVLVISDASTDGTDDIVAEFASRGVELLRLPRRGGKTAAENAAVPHLRGEIVVNSDATIRVPPGSLKHLIRCFGDPEVGVASGRDVSVTHASQEANQGESGYVGYEMGIRRLETAVGGIVGASGCFYAERAELHQLPLPDGLSRDFAAPLVAREHGFRSVSVDAAVCFVPRIAALPLEYRRKVRTMTRGMETLFYKRALLNPFRFGLFAWELFSHKVCRWLLPWAAGVALVALVLLAATTRWADWMLAGAAAVALAAAGGWWWPAGRRLPRALALPAYFVAGNVAALHASFNALRGDLNSIWEPTRRASAKPPA